MEVHRGEVFYADLSPVVGSEQGGVRPVLIVQNEIGNRHSPTVIAAAITSRLDKARLPTHINIRAAAGADPHAGQTPPAGTSRADHPRRPEAGGSGPGRQPGAYLLLTQTPLPLAAAGAFCTRQVKNKTQAAPWKGGGKRCCLLYGNP